MSAKNLTFADKQRIYDENLAREKRFASLCSSSTRDKPEYFLNPYRGAKNQAVTDPVGGSRGKKFLDKDEAFIRSHQDSPAFREALSRSRARSVSPGMLLMQQRRMSGSDSSSNVIRQTPLPDLRQTPTPALADNHNNRQQQQRPSSSVLNFSPSPATNNLNRATNNNSKTSNSNNNNQNLTGIYDMKTSFGRSLARMRMSNAVLKPKTELHGDAIKFDADLKKAQRIPQDRYGYPRTRAQEVGWYYKPLQTVDKPPANCTDEADIKELDDSNDEDFDNFEYVRSDGQQFLLSANNERHDDTSVLSTTASDNNQNTASRARSQGGRAASVLSTRMSTGGFYLAKGLKSQAWK